MLAALQKGIPFARRPFEELSREIGCSESDLMGFVKNSVADGTARRFGAVFDVRRLGYSSALCCAKVSNPDEAASRIAGFQEVTHCYLREAPGCPNLWWTWSAPAEEFESSLAKVDIPFFALPATVRYKIDVMFGVAARVQEESTIDSLPLPDETGRRIIRALQGDTEIRPDYYSAIAEKLGMSEDEVRDIGYIGLMHDCGKLAIPSSILNKPGTLTKEEFDAREALLSQEEAPYEHLAIYPLRAWFPGG